MERYLLFDSGCGRCTQIAKDIAVESDGWLQARSLRDEEMQALLKESNPNWHWQPTLVEIEKGGEIEIATGVRLMAKIVMGLGVQRAWRIAKLLQAAPASQLQVAHPGRRRFLSRGSALLATFPLLGAPSLHRTLASAGSYTLSYQTYRDPDFGFSLEYPSEWQANILEEQPTPLIDDEAILKRIAFSSSPVLVYLDIWMAKGRSFANWMNWYKETRLVDQMTIKSNATVSGKPAVTFLQEHKRDLMLTYFSDGNYVYRLMNWMTGMTTDLNAY